MKNITGMLIRTDGSSASFKTIPANLESYSKTLDCEMIDIVNRQVGYDKAYRMGMRISAVPSCAKIEPSQNDTSE